MYPTYNEKNYERFCGIVIGVAKKLCCVQKGFRRQYGTQTANKFIAELNNARKDKYSLQQKILATTQETVSGKGRESKQSSVINASSASANKIIEIFRAPERKQHNVVINNQLRKCGEQIRPSKAFRHTSELENVVKSLNFKRPPVKMVYIQNSESILGEKKRKKWLLSFYNFVREKAKLSTIRLKLQQWGSYSKI